jgi:hypothetical protein
LQVSAVGPTAPVHAPHAPLLHVSVPREHAPVSVPHGRVVPSVQPQPSSTTPSQSSSTTPSQRSIAGEIPPVHVPQLPAEQVCAPSVQAPVSDPHTRVSPSSTTPSQSSSTPLQLSVLGPTAPVHAPHVPESAHVSVPREHAPVSVPHGRLVPVVHPQPSSTSPSQS